MKKIKILGTTIALSLLSVSSLAQDDEGPIGYTYATYFTCSGDLSVVDDLIAEDAERVNGFVDDGTITGWGWLKHHTGGQWTRIFYYQAETLEDLLAAYDTMNEPPEDAEDGADDEADPFAQVCWGHEDYIWQLDVGSNSEQRGPVGFSVYYDCDITRELDAADLVKNHFAPILDGYVEDGSLASWGWSSHVVGGHIRALQTMTAADLPTLMKARADSISAIYAENSLAGLIQSLQSAPAKLFSA